MVGFNYVIELVPDKKYGALVISPQNGQETFNARVLQFYLYECVPQDPDTGEWNGIVRQILEKVNLLRFIE